MRKSEKILKLIFEAVDEINAARPSNERLKKATDTPLFGGSGKLDSLGFVQFIIAIEQKIEKELHTTVALANEKAMAPKDGPFKTIASLAKYIESVLNE